MFRLEQESPVRPNSLEETTDASSLKDDEIFAEIPDNQQLEIETQPKLKLPVPPPRLPPSFSRPRPDHAPMPITSKPFIGLPRISLGRTPAPTFAKESMTSSEEFLPSMPKRRQLGLIPDKPEFSSVHDPESSELLVNSEDYKNKLSDPDFFQNITKALVFHATNLNDDDNIRLDDPIIAAAAPVQYSPTVFQIQDLNPFGQKPDSVRTESDYNPYPPQPQQQQPQQQQQQQPQPKTIQPEQPRLDEIAPAARSVHQSKDGHVDRPEVVYEPADVSEKKVESRRVDEYQHLLNSFYEGPVQAANDVTDDVTASTEPPMLEELTESVDETVGTTESSTNSDPETTTVYIDPIAEHVNKLLRHYMTTQEPLQEVPSLLFDAETGNVILEYLSPDGERGRVEQPILDIQNTEESTLQTFQAVPQDQQSQDDQLQQMQEAFNEQSQHHQMQDDRQHQQGEGHQLQSEGQQLQGEGQEEQAEAYQGDGFGDYHQMSDDQQQVEFHPEDNYVQVKIFFRTNDSYRKL